jgi:hypothetical protein
MAEVVQSFEFQSRSFGGQARYPYAEWLDGRIWKLVHKTDFQGKPGAFLYALRKRARKSGLQVRANKLDGGKALMIQAYKPEANGQTEAPAPEPKKGRKGGK